MTCLVLSELFVTNLLLFEHQQKKKLLVSWQFSGPYGVTKYGSGWRKDVVNQCLEFDQYQNLSEGADRVDGQLRGDKEYPFSGVTKSDRVWRKVPESDARSVCSTKYNVERAGGISMGAVMTRLLCRAGIVENS